MNGFSRGYGETRAGGGGGCRVGEWGGPLYDSCGSSGRDLIIVNAFSRGYEEKRAGGKVQVWHVRNASMTPVRGQERDLVTVNAFNRELGESAGGQVQAWHVGGGLYDTSGRPYEAAAKG